MATRIEGDKKTHSLIGTGGASGVASARGAPPVSARSQSGEPTWKAPPHRQKVDQGKNLESSPEKRAETDTTQPTAAAPRDQLKGKEKAARLAIAASFLPSHSQQAQIFRFIRLYLPDWDFPIPSPARLSPPKGTTQSEAKPPKPWPWRSSSTRRRRSTLLSPKLRCRSSTRAAGPCCLRTMTAVSLGSFLLALSAIVLGAGCMAAPATSSRGPD